MARRSSRRGSTSTPTQQPNTGSASSTATPTETQPQAQPTRERPFTVRERAVLFAGNGARASGSERTIDLTQYHADDVIEVTLNNGTRLYTTFGQYLNDFPPERPRAATKTGEYLLPLTIDGGGPSRGGAGLMVKMLKLLGVDPIETGATLTARQLSEWYERRQLKEAPDNQGQQRLWRCQVGPNSTFALTKPVQAQDLPTDKPVLIFLHGTASSTAGSFSGLWKGGDGPDVRSELLKQYGEHVYGFEHRTLTESPIENVIALLNFLPQNVRVHLVSHSRGGMLGELLCRGQRQGSDPFTDKDVEFAYAQATPDEQRQKTLLTTLNTALKDRNISVERFVRVACPTRGTSALDERLDRWLSTILNVLDYALPSGLGDFYDVFKDFALALIKTRTKADDLPGLQAMIPNSALVRLLNAPDPVTRKELRVNADLHVIAGDIVYEGGPLWKRLGIWVSDQFYQSEHDLIVHTPAMYGGASRPEAAPARFFFTQGEDVTHFSYFTRAETQQKLLDGLTKPREQDKYEPFDPPTKLRGARAERKRITPPDPTRPTVVLLPGIMGSELTAGDDKIWLSVRLLFGALGRLAITENLAKQETVTATGLMDSAYADLIEFLSKTHNVVPFPYDWRLSLRTEALRFRDRIVQLLDTAEQHKQPVSIIAHSMGGLLARVFIADHATTWQRLAKHADARLLMLGTPNNGSHMICQVLSRRERLVQGLAAADMKHDTREVIEIVKRFPGLLEMLPNYQTDLDFFSLSTWQQLAKDDGDRWTPPLENDLAIAKQTRGLLDQQVTQGKLPVDRMLYIAGSADATPALLKQGTPPSSLHVSKDWPAPPSEGGLYFESSPRGDGRVLWDSGIPKDVPVWYSEATHGDLADHADDFPAILDLLQRGTTTLLPQQPPAVAARAVTDGPAIIPPHRLERYPDDELLEAMALGRAKKPKQRRSIERFEVEVAHGNLIYARYPVAVGHYQGDTIISSEAVLNDHLGGRLAMRRNLDVYPGPIGTCAVFLNEPGQFPGAVVVGLGRVGELTPGKLTTTFTRGALEFALSVYEQRPGQEKDDLIGIQLSSLLVGTTAGGLSLRDSLASLLRGVANANRELNRKDIAVRIEHLEILELWEDRAIEAARLLMELARDAELGKNFKSKPTIEPLRGRRRRTHYEETPGWWERLQITSGDRGELKFTRLTDRARAEVALLPTQRGIVERYIDEATADTVTHPQVARTLFELLLPNDLKARAADDRNVVLVLDDQAAQYPWEMMEDGLVRDRNGDLIARTTQNAKDGILPLAVRAGLLRQRMSEIYRPEPRLSVDNVALVVGNPALNWPIFTDLPGAQSEAQGVTEALQAASDVRGAFEVVECIATDPLEIVNQLFARPYKILHLAGHGVHNFVVEDGSALVGWLENPHQDGRQFRVEEHAQTPEAQRAWFRVEHAPHASGTQLFEFQQGELVSGMVIGRNVFLTPREIRQMRVVPELVFINCCFCGKDTAPPRGRSQLAANLATQLIEMGVRAVIAAGWAVHDGAAKLFAEVFYKEMLAGEAFGRAVHQARKTVYAKYESMANTWGAYQCYGDPDYRLINRRRQDGEEDDIRFVSEAEAIAGVENLYQHALTARESNIAWLKQRLPKLDKAATSQWPRSGLLHSVLGRAYGELDEFGAAIKHYEEALSGERADVDLKALEQLANLKARHAEAKARQVRGETADAEETLEYANTLIEEADALIDKLMQLGVVIGEGRSSTATAERYAVKGSIAKRRAMIATIEGKKDEARNILIRMRDHYKTAAEIAKKSDPYHSIQQILAETLNGNGKLDASTLFRLREELQDVADTAIAGKDEKRDFWSRANTADCWLVRALLDGNLGEQVDEIVEEYREAQSRGASLREWRSVVENLDFIRLFIGAQWPNDIRPEILSALARIYQGLEIFLDEGDLGRVSQAERKRMRRRR